ncbi:MAG: GerMN domain-containing protein [Firmicutes bacterium]|nr:GerMN domain-containing protein [Bacillota bacterium]
MLRFFKNLLIISLICVIAMGIPINQSPIEGNSTKTLGNNDGKKVYLSTQLKDFLTNPKEMTISHKAIGNETLKYNDNKIFKIEIYKNNSLLKTLKSGKISSNKLKLTKSNPYTTTINISQNQLNLPNGNYRLRIKSNSDNMKYITPINLNVNFLSEVPYIKAKNKTPKSLMGLTLFFPSKNYNISQLVGVTRFVKTNKRPLTTTLEELKKGPQANIGLNNTPPIGDFEYVVRKNITYINLPSTEKKYTKNELISKTAMTSMLKSIGSNEEVKTIKFTIDNTTYDKFFNGEVVNKPIDIDFNNRLYLAYNTPKRYFLVDCKLDVFTKDDTLNTKVEKMFDALKNYNVKHLWNPIPKGIELINYNYADNTLTLNFNDKFKSFYKDDNFKLIMLDSILYSFTSIKDIKQVKILINNKTIKTFAGINLEKPLKRPLYINPEVN